MARHMTFLFSFQAVLYVLLLCICSATYLRELRPTLFHRDSTGMGRQFLYKCSVVGDRLSPLVSIGCFVAAGRILFVD